jgi:hypothetical protein
VLNHLNIQSGSSWNYFRLLLVNGGIFSRFGVFGVATVPNKNLKNVATNGNAWIKPRIQKIAATPELVELFRRIRAGEDPRQIDELKRKIAAMRHSADTR